MKIELYLDGTFSSFLVCFWVDIRCRTRTVCQNFFNDERGVAYVGKMSVDVVYAVPETNIAEVKCGLFQFHLGRSWLTSNQT